MYSSVSVMHRSSVTYLTLVATILFRSAGELVIAPRNTESRVGETTYFNCSTDLQSEDIFWYHDNKYIYNGHGILEPYNKRFEIDRNASIGSHNLVIHSVEPGDAGEYICSDDEGAGTTRSAQLIVLDNDPDCQSNMQSDGVIGQNAFNIPLDEVQLTCSVTYHGNTPPYVKWRKVGDNDHIDDSLTSNITSSGRLTLILKFKGDITLDNSSYVCETTKSTQNQHKCTSQTINVLYFVSGNLIEQKVFRGDKITCTTGSNTFPCINLWYHDNKTFDDTITTDSLGEYLCRVQCRIRGTDYTFLALKAFVADPATPALPSTSGKIAASAVVPIIVIIILVVLIAIFVRRHFKRRIRIPGIQEELESLYAKEVASENLESTSCKVTEDEIELLRTIKKRANRREKVITGVAILNQKLFVVRAMSSKLTIYDCNDNFSNFRDWKMIKVKELVAAFAMCSSNVRNCLYVMDCKTPGMQAEVLTISSEGKVLNNWITEKGVFGKISATAEGNVIITIAHVHVLLEHSPNGELVREIKLPFCFNPNHAIKQGDQYIVSHGIYHDPLHRVCLVNQDGTIHRSFDPEFRFMPYCLAAGSSGCVIVADTIHSLVLLLDSNLEFKTKLVPKYKQRFVFPLGLCLGETLLVVVVIGCDPPEETPTEVGEKEAEEGETPIGNNDWQIDKSCRFLIFDVKSVLHKYSG